jgi:Cu(I)/Ag(I) efflux system membrane fusion protein
VNPEWQDRSIDEVREHFEALSGTMLALADAFGHPRSTPLHRAYCPMAFKNKGAAWLQAGEKIANPYFGHKMLRCGEIQRSFAAAGQKNSEEGDR